MKDSRESMRIMTGRGGRTWMQALRTLLLDNVSPVCEYVGRFFGKIAEPFLASAEAKPPVDREEAETIELTEFLDRLGAVEKDEVAKDLTLLWDAFEQQFGGLDGFLAAGEQQKSEYFGRLAGSAGRLTMSRHPRAVRYARSAALMLAYLKAFTRAQPSTADVALGSRIAGAIQSGRSMGDSKPAPHDTATPPVKLRS
jgi:hypothetical protein